MSLILGVNPSNDLQNCETTAAGHLKVDIASSGGGALAANVDVTGNTVGLATSANQSTANSSLSTIATNSTSLAAAVSGNELQVDVITSALPSGAATEATLSAAEVHLGAIDTATSSIQSNVATSSLQTTGNTTLSAISGKLPAALGQDVMADSLAVVIASDQSSIPVSTAGGNAASSSESATPGAGVTTNSTASDMNGSNHVAIFGNSSNTTDPITCQFSADNSTFYTTGIFVNQNFSSGDFAVNIENPAARYVRISQANTTGSSKSLTIITSKK